MPQVLFKKSKKQKQQMDHDDIWDDSLLIQAYEDSVRMRNEDVAKELAMKTNKKSTDEVEAMESGSSQSSTTFKEGDFVRSTFTEDGVDYEAEILTVNENGTCKIRYLGYGNEERVKLEDLVESWGEEARDEQISTAEANTQATNNDRTVETEGFNQFVMNNSRFLNTSIPAPPMPPMPPAMFDNTKDSEYMSAMLMSWYMNGYYTGLYYGRQQGRAENLSTSGNVKAQESQSQTRKKKMRKTQN